ncbi:MAG: asparagine synthase-related protein, partial [Chloroflexi bacterium]|nr:asparagine synthase-related protein [Chloroflexota bacterium]
MPNTLIAQVGTGIFPYNQFSESHGIHVGLHGEIYRDDRDEISPLDYIRDLYLKKGKLFAAGLNGSFIVFLHDSTRQCTYLVTDHVGSRPVVFYQMKSGAIIFAPEVKPISDLKGEVFRADLMAIADMLTSGNLTGARTFVKDVNRMGPAEVLEVGVEGLKRYRYWEFELNEDPAERAISFYQQGLAERLQKAVDRRLRGINEGNYAIFLSGGKDSRGILGCAVQNGHKVQTVAYGFSREKRSDASTSAQLSRMLDVPHLYVQCDLDQYVPFEESSAYLYNGMRGPSLEWPM